MERKLNKIVNCFNEERVAIIEGLCALVVLVIAEAAGILIVVSARNYLLLSMSTYMWVDMITECFIKKYFFRKLDCFLIKSPKTTNLVFFIVGVITIVVSWKYFIAFILCIPQAIIFGEFRRLTDPIEC